MYDLVYWGFVTAGAVTLVIEAYRNFNSPSARHPFVLHPILKDVEVRNLCTTGEIIAGFAFYAVIYLIAYVVVLSSAEVYGLLMQANNALDQIGATDQGTVMLDDTATLSAAQYDKPILVSALIISSLSLGAVKPIETTLRSLAHRLAGVPRGVYRVIKDLGDVPYEKLMAGHPKRLVERFNQRSEGKVPEEWRRPIVESLTAIDCLSIATDPNNRVVYFPLYNVERLKSLSDKLGQDIDRLETLMDVLPVQNDEALEEKYDQFADEAALARSNIMALFAVLYIRNDHAIYSSRGGHGEKADPIMRIRNALETSKKDEHNSFGLSIVIAFVIAFLCAFFLYYIWYYWYAAANPIIYLSSGPEGTVDPGLLSTCQQEKLPANCVAALQAWRHSRIDEILSRASWDQLQTLLVTTFSVLLVILGREVRIEQQSWRENWKFYQFPFLRMLAMSLLSGLVAVFLTALVEVGELSWDTNLTPTRMQIIDLFQQSGRFFAMQAGAGIILAMAALIIMDKHRSQSVLFTLVIAAIASLLYFLYQWAILFVTVTPSLPPPPTASFSQTIRDALILSVLPVCFLIVFSLLLEWSEHGRESSRAVVPVVQGGTQ
ncbi:hypothetical protein [Neorhizobium alkalisoli]|uniref:hypothetical protein n=1 Tax=Neorhizobium alkalisoli TaxID=528178 RepID=UPI000CF9F492|nr:hypothetical protein [Neorhizobium alkalisoli]